MHDVDCSERDRWFVVTHKWWGPMTLVQRIEGNPVPVELRCGFCKLPPLPGQEVFGIADLIWHFDFKICQDVTGRGETPF